MALMCKESLDENGFNEEKYRVVYKRPTDLIIGKDVPICCNLLLCDILDEGDRAISYMISIEQIEKATK